MNKTNRKENKRNEQESALGPFEVFDASQDVKVNHGRIPAVAQWITEQMEIQKYSTSTWSSHALHPKNKNAGTLAWIFLVDTLNFSFWTNARGYSVEYNGVAYTGYWSLCAVVNRALDEGIPILSPVYWKQLTINMIEHLFRGNGKCPMLTERLHVLNDVSEILIKDYKGSIERVIQSANQSAQKLLEILVNHFGYVFNDIHMYNGTPVRILKRPQIMIADIWACFDGKGYGEFFDIDSITMFADYRLPQALVALGILSYSDKLISLLKKHELVHASRTVENTMDYCNEAFYLVSGSPMEVEIRGSSIFAVELIVQEIRRTRPVNAILVDFYLWDYIKQNRPTIPIHRCRSIYY